MENAERYKMPLMGLSVDWTQLREESKSRKISQKKLLENRDENVRKKQNRASKICRIILNGEMFM